jgi:transcription factor TFIIIB component B''
MCIDRRTGKKSSRYPELQEAERQRRRLKALKRDQVQDPENAQQAEAEAEAETEELTNEPLELAIPAAEDDDTLLPASSSTALVMTDSNDNIIIDRSTLQIDRQPLHPSQMTDSLIHTTETIFSSKVNSGTYPSARTHAPHNIRWLPADNQAFYQALQMFGTDFELVAEWVGGKTRRHVKNKFYREEKTNGDKLTWALKNRIPADVKELERRRGRKLRKLDEMEEWDIFRQEAAAIKALPRISETEGLADGKGKARETLLGDF